MKQKIIRTFLSLLTLPIVVVMSIPFLAVTGCDEAGMMKPVVPVDGGTEPVEPEPEPTEPEPTEPTEPEPTPEPTVAIAAAVQEDDGSVRVSGTSTDVPEGTTVTVTLGADVTAMAATNAKGKWTVTVPAADVEALPAGTVTVTAVADEATDTDSLVITEPEVPPPTVTLPPGYELPPELIPVTPPTLSADEAALIEADKWVQQNHPDFDVTAPKLRTQAGHTADLISLLPHKEREEVYELFVTSVNLPSFSKAAQRMWEINLQLRILDGEGERTGNWDPYWDYRITVETEQGFSGSNDLNILGDIYLEENPQDTPYTNEGISFYWIILEYYRLQLENPGLPNLLQKNNPTGLLKLFRQSCRSGYVFGLDNPLG